MYYKGRLWHRYWIAPGSSICSWVSSAVGMCALVAQSRCRSLATASFQDGMAEDPARFAFHRPTKDRPLLRCTSLGVSLHVPLASAWAVGIPASSRSSVGSGLPRTLVYVLYWLAHVHALVHGFHWPHASSIGCRLICRPAACPIGGGLELGDRPGSLCR